jgi:peroxiredoxin
MPVVRFVLVIGLVAGALAACTGKHAVANGPQQGDQGYVNGQGTVQVMTLQERVPAPNIEGTSLTGGLINLRDYAGDVVVLNFWAAWCPPCRAEQAKLNAVYDAVHGKGVQFIGIDINDNDAAARAFIRTHGVAYQSIVDKDTAIPLEFDPRLPGTPPSTVIIDRSGRVAAKILGPAAKGVLQPLAEQFAAESS